MRIFPCKIASPYNLLGNTINSTTRCIDLTHLNLIIRPSLNLQNALQPRALQPRASSQSSRRCFLRVLDAPKPSGRRTLLRKPSLLHVSTRFSLQPWTALLKELQLLVSPPPLRWRILAPWHFLAPHRILKTVEKLHYDLNPSI
jgi:hypothetical protein